jgi:hypothetical protein
VHIKQRQQAMTLLGIVWFMANVVIVMLLRPPTGQMQERLIVRFPGAWIIVGLPLTLSFGASVLLTAFSLY